jgi:hypothetical protein
MKPLLTLRLIQIALRIPFPLFGSNKKSRINDDFGDVGIVRTANRGGTTSLGGFIRRAQRTLLDTPWQIIQVFFSLRVLVEVNLYSTAMTTSEVDHIKPKVSWCLTVFSLTLQKFYMETHKKHSKSKFICWFWGKNPFSVLNKSYATPNLGSIFWNVVYRGLRVSRFFVTGLFYLVFNWLLSFGCHL